MPELKVPLAKDGNGVIVKPDNADKGRSYYCPGCGDNLILRKGEKKAVHFAHKATDTCSYETIIHKLAKHQLAQVINAYVENKIESPVIERKCKTCQTVTEQTLPQRITSAAVEKKLESGFVADVAIVANEEVAAAVEVKVAHAVPDEKKKLFGVPFIEVDGESIVENPMRWKPLEDHFRPFKCGECTKALLDFNKAIEDISKESGVFVPNEYYRTASTECWRCKKNILVFSWPERENEEIIPRDPRPKTIQYRYSKMAGSKYWVNTCPYCKSIQGDFFLYSEPDSPLFGFNCGDDSIESYKSDMQALAIHYKHGC